MSIFDEVKELEKTTEDLNNKVYGNDKVRAILMSHKLHNHILCQNNSMYEEPVIQLIKYMGFDVYRTRDIKGDFKVLYR